jgi:drug/metabolite transporter (DMT)-like permease
LLRNPRWIAATLGNAVGYGLQAAALGVGSVVVVEPILVTSLLFALPLSARLAHQRLPSTAVVSALLLSVSLSVVVILGDGNRGLDRASYQGWLIVTIVAVPLVAGCLIFAHAKSGAARASVLAIAVGLLGGALAVLTKSVVDAGSGGVVHLLGTGETYALIVVGLGGTYLQQLSFQAGTLQASLPIMTVLEPTVAAVLGLTLLHEQLQTGDFG